MKSFVQVPVSAGLSVLTLLLSACGGGGDDGSAGAAPATGGSSVTVVAAPLVVSAAAPATLNGTLNKTATAGQESGISNSTGSYSSTAANDYCRVATYALPNSGNGYAYDLTVVYAKSDRGVSYIMLSSAATAPAFAARAAGTAGAPVPGIAIDVVNRRIGFTNVVLGSGGAQAATLNGSLEYATNAVVADRAACG